MMMVLIAGTLVVRVACLSFGWAEQLYGRERFSRPRPEAIEGELGLLARFDIHQHIVVFLVRRLPLPVEVRRIVGRELDARAPRENRVLLGPATAEQQVL